MQVESYNGQRYCTHNQTMRHMKKKETCVTKVGQSVLLLENLSLTAFTINNAVELHNHYTGYTIKPAIAAVMLWKELNLVLSHSKLKTEVAVVW